MDPKTVVYESSDDEEYSYGWDDFKIQVASLDHFESPTRPLTKALKEKLAISQEITPRAPKVDMHSRRRVLHDKELREIDEVARRPIESDSDSGSQPSTEQSLFSSRTTSMSSVESTGLKRAPDWSLPPPPAVKRKFAPTTPTVNLPQVGKNRKHCSPEFGVELNIKHIAHCEKAQVVLDRHELAWGTIFELARGVTRNMWTFEDMTEHRLQKLKGSNAQSAWKVAAVMKDKVPSAIGAPSELWVEYDREQLAIVENKGRGLGTMGQWEGKDNWYGGKIQQVARVVKAGASFRFELEKPEIRRSHRFARFLGSRRILQVRVPDNLTYDKVGSALREFLISSKFVLCGRVFVPFHAKEGSMYLLETSENIDRQSTFNDGDSHRLTLYNFVKWHNPLRLNSTQPISKWSTRWALGLSTSVPTIEFSPENIIFICDQHAVGWGEGKPPAEKIMTDGCGFISGAALTAIMRVMKYSSRPTAVQGRIAGAKGMWVLHPDPAHQLADGPPMIWIRDSQNKINLGSLHEVDKAHRIFDLLAPSRVTGPSRLSSQTLVNLAHGRVPLPVLKELMADGLHEEVQQLTEWTGPDSMLMVWRAVEQAGRVVTSRLRRRIAGQARALGLGQLRPNDELAEIDDNDDAAVNQAVGAPVHQGRNPHSGEPLTLHESVLELLQAGFHPLKLDRLFYKLEYVVTLVLDEYIEKFHIPVKESLEAYIIPDPYGVLEEGQIHFRSSDLITDPESGTQMDIVTGSVLVWRNPTRLPSDVQKVTAVSHPKLANYFDVIIFPVKGERSLASYLGGGDYDGDTVTLVWSKRLVENFHTTPLCTAPAGLSNDFEREVEHVVDFDRRVSKLSAKEAQTAFQKVLLLGLAETKIGLYSKFHDLAVYERGYASAAAIRLAYMFTTCLDASKTGLRVKAHVFDQDRKSCGNRKPYYMVALEQSTEGQEVSTRKGSTPYILDALVDEGRRLRDNFLKQYSDLRNSSTNTEDQDLTSPYMSATRRATQASHAGLQILRDNLRVIEVHVQRAYKDWQLAVALQKNVPKVKGAPDPKAQEIQKSVQSFARRPEVLFFSGEELKIIMASYAYKLSGAFGFSVAFAELCAIKARVQGAVLFAHRFSDVMCIPNNILRAISQAQDDADD
ncbi:RNA dependent RNA polymerase-domain-containing protein [Suillus clintonianus]|uniref:RNA dependent RNA polymerase-domain-containing protein n=1 Tax=Suillus clintonianus TaxID=1904413 RepID=UPI001B876795|nr:RNA dependent RNA polymerase-domain-containing protein [Suillus clintonianus]KAG2141030.1 RNA dependent RNA polymerase-domain-containing protein [Suillus clintonianus]